MGHWTHLLKLLRCTRCQDVGLMTHATWLGMLTRPDKALGV